MYKNKMFGKIMFIICVTRPIQYSDTEILQSNCTKHKSDIQDAGMPGGMNL